MSGIADHIIRRLGRSVQPQPGKAGSRSRPPIPAALQIEIPVLAGPIWWGLFRSAEAGMVTSRPPVASRFNPMAHSETQLDLGNVPLRARSAAPGGTRCVGRASSRLISQSQRISPSAKACLSNSGPIYSMSLIRSTSTIHKAAWTARMVGPYQHCPFRYCVAASDHVFTAARLLRANNPNNLGCPNLWPSS